MRIHRCMCMVIMQHLLHGRREKEKEEGREEETARGRWRGRGRERAVSH